MPWPCDRPRRSVRRGSIILFTSFVFATAVFPKILTGPIWQGANLPTPPLMLAVFSVATAMTLDAVFVVLDAFFHMLRADVRA